MKKGLALLLALAILTAGTALADSADAEISYDASSLEALAESMAEDAESVLDALEDALDQVVWYLSDTYEAYVENEYRLNEWYDLSLSETEALFERIQAGSEAYFELIVTTCGTDDLDALTDALDEYYDEICDDLMSDYYDALYSDLYLDIYDEYYNGLLYKQPDGVEEAEWENTRNQALLEWNAGCSAVFSSINLHTLDFYHECMKMLNGFTAGVYDVGAILTLSYFDGDLLGALDGMASDADACAENLLAAIPSADECSGDTAEDYAAAAAALEEWYALALSEIETLYDGLVESAYACYELIADTIDHDDADLISAVLNEIYYAVCIDAYYELYYAIYFDALDSIYADFLWGVLYSPNIDAWDASEDWEACCSAWSDASDAIPELLDELSEDAYDTWTAVYTGFLSEGTFDVDAILAEAAETSED